MRILSVLCLLVTLTAAQAVEVVAVNGPNEVVVEIYNVPVAMRLAHVAVPDDQEIQEQCTAKLKELVEGQKVKLKYDAAYGEHAGTGRVQLLKSLKSINVKLLEAGLATYEEGGDDKYATQMKEAEAVAKKAKKGIWSKPPAKKVAAKKPSAQKDKKPTRNKPAESSAKKVTAPYCAELSGKYYYASSSSEAKRLNPKKLVYYKTEKEAQKAGKKKPAKKVAKKIAQTMEAADAEMAKGEEHYYKAVDMPVSDARDNHYGEAFKHFTNAMLVYRAFYEKDQDNAKLGEQLRQCMQLRYGAMKYKRP